MAYEGYLDFNGTEIVNVARTGRLAVTLGLGQVLVNGDRAAALQTRLTGIPADPESVFYQDITLAPWYDDGFKASEEFAGLMPLSVQGLDDSTLQAEVTEYITDGGNSSTHRNSTLSIVCSMVILAKSERGAEYGLRWLNRTLRGRDSGLGSGYVLTYMRYLAPDAPLANRQRVNISRAATVSRKRTTRCLHAWTVNFTLTADDPYEYGEPEQIITNLGRPPTGNDVGRGVLFATETPCTSYDYSPLYDPLYPALVPSPTAPQFLPPGWGWEEGVNFQRDWLRVQSIEPSQATAVPVIKFTSPDEARNIRLLILPSGADPTDTCSALFTVILTYLPPDTPVYVDAVRRAVYAWDGFSPTVRRCDTLAFGPEGKPVPWASISGASDITVALDAPLVSPGVYQGGGAIRVAVDMVAKSD